MEILYVRQKLFREKRRVRIRSRGSRRNGQAAGLLRTETCLLYTSPSPRDQRGSENVTAMQEQLADLTEANNTAYNSAADSVNLETVRDRAMNEMGMVYAAQGTIVEYDSPEGDYVKQYNDIPESGVLAKSSDVLK